jgi:hypothetical protein
VHKLSKLQKHNRVSLSDPRAQAILQQLSSASSPSSSSVLPVPLSATCRIHIGVPLYEYCFTDKTLVCNICREHSHKGHDVKELNAAHQVVKTRTEEQLVQLQV